MAQHDFVPAWLNFSTPQPAKSPAAPLEKHGEHFPRGDSRPGVNRRRHNSSDGFFNNDPLRASGGDGWQQPSLLRHDSVDSGVAKGSQVGLGGGPVWKESPSWHGAQRGQEGPHHHHARHIKRGGGERDRQGGHRQRNGNFHPRKGGPYQDRYSDEERNDDKLKFVDEDFPSLNPETTGKPASQPRAVGTPAGVWENPPSAKQAMSKMLVIKKVSKEDPSAAFSAGFASAGPLPANGSKVSIPGPSVYKNLVPKTATAPTKPGPWKPNGRETKVGLHFSGRDSAFTSPVSVTKPLTPISAPAHGTSKEPPSSTTPPIDITPSRLKLMRRSTDRKSEFLRGLKDERNGDVSDCHSPGAPAEGEGSTPEPKEFEESHENGISHSLSDSDPEHLSSSLEAEHRLLKAMGWQEYPENDDNFQPLTEDELKEFQAKTEQMKKIGLGRNGVLLKPRSVTLLTWRNAPNPGLEECSESETSSSSQTSDDDDT
ncbi:vasculin-like protein 1 [Sinocyclocheilus grahami]|uniref:GC-rich promoter binding protein 1 like 1 n=1 Tax=Sinocyclocheilus grahami TaxID=75366 RepID=A0A672K358_SINGR|nr:PREDICTED: vasculin-like protein 1 [Sinocyclocheilus grahami]XP_016088019.1 PREDICTED: vasculin-like protein 1 [Sinocyclocheilus grahami]